MYTVYGQPACSGCSTVKLHCDRKGIEYCYVDVTQDAAAYAHVVSLGYSGLPVIEDENGNHFQGFRPDKLI